MSKKYRCVEILGGGSNFTVGRIYALDGQGRLRADDGFPFGPHYPSTVAWLEHMDYYKFEEVKDMFTKSDLRNGDVVVTRNNKRYVFIRDYAGSGDDVFAELSKRGRELLSFYDDELHNENSGKWDIMKVYRCDDPRYFCQWNTLTDYRLLYDRNKVEERKKMTVEQIEAELGYKIAIVDEEGKEK